ncbi:MAG: hypothetical protein JW801_06045 [Bacteroidales bacterium]|nr:hypothetical protein [Bacteroidales bacterium]
MTNTQKAYQYLRGQKLFIRFSVYTLLLLFFLSGCRKDNTSDFRDNLTGTYSGTESYEYYSVHPMDSVRTISEEGSSPREILINKGECEACVVLIRDTINMEGTDFLVTDTLEFSDDNSFEATFALIGDTYYREYTVLFDDDSLRVAYHWVIDSESYRYLFKGKRHY